MSPVIEKWVLRLRYVFLESETVAVRAFFATITLGYALFMPHAAETPQYEVALMLMPAWVWSVGFALNGSALLYGVMTRKSGKFLLALEGMLGVVVWLTMGIATAVASGTVGPTMMASFIAIWIYVRYPEWK